MSTSSLLFDPWVIHNMEGRSFLDVGCGYGKWGYLLKKYRSVPGDAASYVVGVDRYVSHLSSLARHRVYDALVHADGICLPFRDRSFDSIVACEVLEHVPKACGTPMIQEMKRVARRSFVVTTPNFSCLRDGAMTLDGMNEYEAHRCSYTYGEFRALGFTQVIGVGVFRTPSWRLGMALSSLGVVWPSRSRLLMGFWFADGRRRNLVAE